MNVYDEINVYDEYLKKEGLKIPHEGDVEGTVAAEMRNDAIERIFYGKTYEGQEK